MSIQEYKQRLHEVIDGANDEAALHELLDTANRLLSDLDILDELTPGQLAGLMEAREQVDAGNFVTLDEFKKRMEERWLERKK